jgi:hypothetical protein
MSFTMVKENRTVIIAHAKQGYGAVDMRVFGTNNVAGRYVDNVLTLIGEHDLHGVIVEANRWSTAEEDGILQQR